VDAPNVVDGDNGLTLRALRGHLPGLGLVLLAALAVRLAWVACIHPDPADGRFDDTVWYRGAAHYLSRGEGYLNPFSGTPTAAWPPGYPAFLAAVFKLSGEGVAQTIGANIAVSLLTVVVAYAIGLLLFDARAALLGAGALALWPGQVYFTSLTLSEPLFTLLFAAAVLLMLVVAREQRHRWAALIAFGAVLAAATLTRGQALILLPCAIVVWSIAGYRWRATLGWGALTLLVVCAMITPWTLRNWHALGNPVAVSTNTGPNFWIGHHDGATGRMAIGGEAPPLTERGDRTLSEWEAANDRLALREGLEYALTHPIDDLRLAGAKVRALYESDSVALDWNSAYERDSYYASPEVEDALRALANGFWFSMIALSGAGLVAIVRGGAAAASDPRIRLRHALPAIVLFWTAAHVAFFGDPRFHYPIVFVFALMGARGAVAAFDALPARRRTVARRYAQA
jgi:4-amino-4-deoxy-L-arabinose transferase-like glycosyltransferase